MGREASAICTLAGHTEPVKALLEAETLMLRGATLRRRLVLAGLRHAQVDGGQLLLVDADGTRLSLDLGATEAAKWLARLNSPAPTLATKLGLKPGHTVWTLGPVADEPLLVEALAPHRAESAAQATLWLAVVPDAAAVQAALHAHQAEAAAAVALWLVYTKGPKAQPGDSWIRQTLRAAGHVDSKSCAVSERLTATRYSRRQVGR